MTRTPKYFGVLFSLFGLSIAVASAAPLVGVDQFVTTPSQNTVVIPMAATGGSGSYTFSYPFQQTVGAFVQTGPDELTYTPNPTFSGVDTAFYEVTDGIYVRSAIVVVAVNIPANAFTTNCYIFHPGLGQWVLIGSQQGLGALTVSWNPSSINPPLTSGTYQFQWEVVLGGNVVAQGGPSNHIVDMVAPVVTWIDYPGIGTAMACVSDDIRFEMSAIDDLAVAPDPHIQTPQYMNPGIPPTNFDFLPTSTFQQYIVPDYQTTQLQDGIRQFRAFAADVPGNRSAEITFAVNVDNTAPTNLSLGFVPALPVVPVIRGSRTVTFSATDANCGIGELKTVVESVTNTTIGNNFGQSSLSSVWNTNNFSDGFYTVRGLATDHAGNTNSVASILIRVDNSSPTILSIGIPANLTTSGANINWTTDEVADSQVEYGLTTAYGNTTPVNTSLLLSHNEPLAGLQANTVYHYRVRSRDEAGNLTVSSDQTFQTLSLPSASMTAPVSNATVAGANVAVAAAASANTVGVQFQLDGNNLGVEDTSAPFSITWNTLLASQGAHALRAVARDAANNLVPSAPINVSVDNAAPAISAINTTNMTMNGVTINWVTNELADSRVEYGLSTSYGNSTVLNSALSMSHSEPMTGLLPNTLYHFRVISRDAMNNTATSNDGTFSTNALPTITVTSPVNNAQVGGPNVLLSASASANVTSVQFKFNNAVISPVLTGPSPFSFQWNTTGIVMQTANVVAEGNYGGSGPVISSPINLTVDNLGPVLANINANNLTSFEATINWTSNEPATTQVEYGFTTSYGNITTENTTLTTTHSQNLSALQPNTVYHYRVRSRDGLGNLSISADFTFTTNALPTISVTAPQGGAIVRGNVPMAAQVSVPPLGVQFTVDGSPVGAEVQTPPYQTVWNSGSLNGNSVIRAVARYAGNSVPSSPINITVDNMAPTISNILPADNATLSGNVILEFSAQDGVGLDILQIWVSGVLIHSKQSLGATSDNIQFSFNSVGIPNASYIMTARAVDRAGNEVMTNRTFHIQNSAGANAPVVTILSPVEGVLVHGFMNNGSIRARITNNPTPSSVEMRIDNGSAVSPVNVNGDIYDFEWNTLSVLDGLHSISVSASNVSGTGSDSNQVDVDNTLPVINWIEPVANQQLFYDVNLIANVSDAGRSTVDEVRFYFNTPNNVIASFSDDPSVGLLSRVIDTRLFADTNYSLFAVATDHAGNVSSPALVPVFIDNVNIPISTGSLILHPLADAFVTNQAEAEIRVRPDGITIDLDSITPTSFEVEALINGETQLVPGSALFQNGDVIFTGSVPQNSRVTVRTRFRDSLGKLLESSWSFVYGSNRSQATMVTSVKDGVRITVQIPANTLEHDAVVEILPIELNQMPQAMMEANQTPSGIPNLEMWKLPYLITAKDAFDNEVSFVTNGSASFIFEDQIPDPVQKFVFRAQALDEGQKLWKLLGGNGLLGASDAPIAKTITASINKLGYFRVVNFPAATSGISDVFNFPNPFSPRDGGTTLSYLLSEDSEVTLVLYDLLGNLVKKMNIPQGAVGGSAGLNNVLWDGRNGEGTEVANGGYLLQILAKGSSGTSYKERHKVAVLK